METGKYREAVTEFSKIDSTQSNFELAKRNIAQCYLQLAWEHREDTDVSFAYFDTLDINYVDTQNDTTYSNYQFYFGSKLYDAGELRDAYTVLERVTAGSNVRAAKEYLVRLKPEIEKAERAARIDRLKSRIYGNWVLVSGWIVREGSMRITRNLMNVTGIWGRDYFDWNYYIPKIELLSDQQVKVYIMSDGVTIAYTFKFFKDDLITLTGGSIQLQKTTWARR